MPRCPLCNARKPHLHPATGEGGEAIICSDSFHLQPTHHNTVEYIERVKQRRIDMGLEVFNPPDYVYMRDLDGTGSMHVCAKGDPGAIEYVKSDLAFAAIRRSVRIEKCTCDQPLIKYNHLGCICQICGLPA